MCSGGKAVKISNEKGYYSSQPVQVSYVRLNMIRLIEARITLIKGSIFFRIRVKIIFNVKSFQDVFC